MDQRKRKLITMHKTFLPRDDVARLYVSREEGRRGLVSIEDSVQALIQRFEAYMEKRGRRMITTTRNNIEKTRINRTEKTRKQKKKKGERKQLYASS